MLRGHRHIFFALVGWLTLANAQGPSTDAQQPKAEANQAQTAPAPSPPAAQSVEPVESPELYRPCDQGQDARNSDLCAQWKAADAARDAADWTQWGVIIGIFGTIGLFWTLYYTRAAVKAAQEATQDADTALIIAKKSANAATRLAKNSERAAQIQLRAYLTVQGIEVEKPHLRPEGRFSNVVIRIVNNGQTPALITRFDVQFLWSVGGMFTTLLEIEKKTKIRVHRGGKPSNLPMFIAAEGDGLNEHGQLLATVVVDYEDVFEKERSEVFCFQAGEGKETFNQLGFPYEMRIFPLPDYLDHLGLDENLEPKDKSEGEGV